MGYVVLPSNEERLSAFVSSAWLEAAKVIQPARDLLDEMTPEERATLIKLRDEAGCRISEIHDAVRERRKNPPKRRT